jgi:hypothetical protein
MKIKTLSLNRGSRIEMGKKSRGDENLRRRMLKTKIEPTMSMKTNGRTTKWPVSYRAFLPNLHRFCENGRKSIGLWLKMYCDHLGSGGGGAGPGGAGPNPRNGVVVPKFLFGCPDLSEAVKAPFHRRAHRWGWTQASMGVDRAKSSLGCAAGYFRRLQIRNSSPATMPRRKVCHGLWWMG